MRNVLLRITGKQYQDGGSDADPIEFVTEGRFYEKDGVRYLEYDESELSGMEGCTTLLEIRPQRVYMTRSGAAVALDTIMDFETGKRCSSIYQTPFGPIGMELLTNSVRNRLSGGTRGSGSPLSGGVFIDYHVSLRGMGEMRNLLNIEILEDRGEIPETILN